MIFGVWFAAAQIGLSLFYWWFHTIDKTASVFVVLVYIVACTVAGSMLSMVEGRPTITALSLAVMSGPFASARRGRTALRLLLVRADRPLSVRRHSVTSLLNSPTWPLG